MSRTLVAALAVFAAAPAFALDPGEWQFTTTMTAPGMPKPQTMTNTRCIKPAEASDPEKFMSQQKQSDCKTTSSKKTGDTYTWEMNCPTSGMTGTGTVRQAATTMDMEMVMKGPKMEMRSQTTGKRLGACK